MSRHFVPGCSGSPSSPGTTSQVQARPKAPQPLRLAGLLAVVLLVSGYPQASAVTYTVPSTLYPTIQSAVDSVHTPRTQPVTILVSGGPPGAHVRVRFHSLMAACLKGYPVSLSKKSCAPLATYRQCADQHFEKTPASAQT